jgi:WD40 repeat protein
MNRLIFGLVILVNSLSAPSMAVPNCSLQFSTSELQSQYLNLIYEKRKANQIGQPIVLAKIRKDLNEIEIKLKNENALPSQQEVAAFLESKDKTVQKVTDDIQPKADELRKREKKAAQEQLTAIYNFSKIESLGDGWLSGSIKFNGVDRFLQWFTNQDKVLILNLDGTSTRLNLMLGQDRIYDGKLANDGSTAFFALSSGEVIVFDLLKNSTIKRWKAHEEFAEAIEIDSANKILYTGGRDGRARSWNLSTGELLQEFVKPAWYKTKSEVYSIRTMATTGALLVGTGKGEVLHFNSSSKLVKTYKVTDMSVIKEIVVSKDEQLAAVSILDGGLVIIDLKSGQLTYPISRAELGFASSLQIADNLKSVRYITRDGEFVVLELATKTIFQKIKMSQSISAIARKSDSDQLILFTQMSDIYLGEPAY